MCHTIFCIQNSGNRTILEWRHNRRDSASNYQPHDCLPNRSFRHRWKKSSKLLVTGLYAGNSAVNGEFPAQRVSYPENVSISWRHDHDLRQKSSLPWLQNMQPMYATNICSNKWYYRYCCMLCHSLHNFSHTQCQWKNNCETGLLLLFTCITVFVCFVNCVDKKVCTLNVTPNGTKLLHLRRLG